MIFGLSQWDSNSPIGVFLFAFGLWLKQGCRKNHDDSTIILLLGYCTLRKKFRKLVFGKPMNTRSVSIDLLYRFVTLN